MNHKIPSLRTFILILICFSGHLHGQIEPTFGASNYLKETMPGEERELGEFLDYDGTRIASNAGKNQVAIFALTESGWIQEDLIDLGEERITDIAISGDTLAVGASINSDLANNAGLVLVFNRDDGGQWIETVRLNSGTPVDGQRFGIRVALDGATLAVSGVGTVWALEFSGGSWGAATVVATEASDIRFADALEISGDRIVAGAERGNSNGALGEVLNSGFANVYSKTGSTWSLEQSLQASNAETNDSFGFAVDIDGDRIIVGAVLEDSNATGVGGDGANNSGDRSGAAYIFERNTSSGTWEETAYLKGGSNGADDGIGEAVSIRGDLAVIGAKGEDGNSTEVNGNSANNSKSGSGAAWVYERVNGAWEIGDYLKAPNADRFDRFGIQVGVSGTTVIVAANEEESSTNIINGRNDLNDTFRAGAIYVFEPGGMLPEVGELLPIVSFSSYDSNAPPFVIREGGATHQFRIARSPADGELAISFRLTGDTEASPDEIEITKVGSAPDLNADNGVYSFVFSDGVAEVTYRMNAIEEENDEAESLEAITLEFVESELYDISPTLQIDTFAIRYNGFLVTNTQDSGSGSLRQAIFNANDTPEEDAIRFSDGSDGFIDFSDGTLRTIFLTEQLVITNPVDIYGPGMDALEISGNSNGDFIKDPGECRILFLEEDGPTYPRPVVLFGLTFRDGIAGLDKDPRDPEYDPPFGTDQDEGGLIHGGFSSTFSLLIQECRFQGGTASGDSGAFHPSSADSFLKVNGCQFIENTAFSRGGAALTPGVYTDCIFTRNRAGNEGGAVYSEGGGFIRCEFSYNEVENFKLATRALGSTARGGAIYVDGEECTIGDCLIIGNKCTGEANEESPGFGDADGGGLYLVAASTGIAPQLIYNTTIADNEVVSNGNSSGAGVYVFVDPLPTSSQAPVSPVRFFQTTVSGNKAEVISDNPEFVKRSRGGGMYILRTSEESLLDNCTITNNSAEVGAGLAIFRDDKPDVYQSIIAGNNGDDIASIAPTYTQDDPDFPGRGGLNSLGYNIFGVGSATGDFNETGDQTGILDPGLGPLADNGGLVLTHNLLSFSPALDAGDPNPSYRPWQFSGGPLLDEAVEKDVRGGNFGSTFGASRDIGALEFDPVVTTTIPFAISGIVKNEDGSVRIQVECFPGSLYFLEYSDSPDNFVRIEPGVTAATRRLNFVDDGTFTPSLPNASGSRFYRVTEDLTE